MRYYINVNEDKSREVQDILFKNGYKWFVRGKAGDDGVVNLIPTKK
jgi:hypothetical protein